MKSGKEIEHVEANPAIFFGHGNPMNALQSNAWTTAWAAIGNSFDFRSESERSIGGKDDTLANSNERGDKGFITTSVVHLKH